MKLKGLLLLLLLLALLFPLSTLFSSASVPDSQYVGIGNSVVVVAKENYVYARVEITVQPLANNTGVVVVGEPLEPVILTLPNGTAIKVTKDTTYTFILPNGVLSNPAVGAAGPGYDVSPSSPLSVQFVSGQSATYAEIGGPIPGINIIQYTLSGDYGVSVSALGVSL